MGQIGWRRPRSLWALFDAYSAKVEDLTTATHSMWIVFCGPTFALFSLKTPVKSSNCAYLKSYLVTLLKISSLRF